MSLQNQTLLPSKKQEKNSRKMPQIVCKFCKLFTEPIAFWQVFEGLCDLIRTQWRIDQTELIIRSISHQKERKMEEKEISKKKMKEKEISTC